MRYQHVIILASVAIFVLAGCGSSNSGSASPPPPSPGLNSAEKIFLADPNGDPVDILDAGMLAADIDSIFGDVNAEPVVVDPGDTIADVLDRAKSS